jgi:hypothetical protein
MNAKLRMLPDDLNAFKTRFKCRSFFSFLKRERDFANVSDRLSCTV